MQRRVVVDRALEEHHGALHVSPAERLLPNGQLEEVRIQIISAYQHDPGNGELKGRLDILLYEVLALEPPSRLAGGRGYARAAPR
jgi:hypothetical protein